MRLSIHTMRQNKNGRLTYQMQVYRIHCLVMFPVCENLWTQVSDRKEKPDKGATEKLCQ